MIKPRHKWLLAVGLLLTITAWLAWIVLTAESDLMPN
jgi:hypothetical protein